MGSLETITHTKAETRSIHRGAVIAMVGLLGLFGCSDDDRSEPQTSNVPTSTNPNATTMTFDSLSDVGTTVIQVYPGVTEAEADRQYNGTYLDGEVVTVDCKTRGRTVVSDPSLSEVLRESNQWIHLASSNGEDRFATAVYIEEPEAVLAALPECT